MKNFDQSTQALDELDWRLLAILQRDASLTNAALAQAAGTAPATALRRVRRMREAGVIEHIVAMVAPTAVPGGMHFISEITLDRQDAQSIQRFELRAVAEPMVQQCWRVLSGPDFILVIWASSLPSYSTMVERLFTQDSNVRNVRTFTASQRTKFGSYLLPSSCNSPG